VAIYSLTVQTIGRGAGRSVIAAAAYRSCSSLSDNRLAMEHDFTAKAGGLEHCAILAPENAPREFLDRETLWNAVDRAEHRKDAVTAQEILVALPHELTDAQRRELVEEFARKHLVEKGMIADYAIHRPSHDGDQRNHHAHIMVTTRHVGHEGFGGKNRDWHKAEFVEQVRTDWATIANQHLARHTPGVKISEKTLAEQGIDRAPAEHKGPEVTAMERRGERTTKGEHNRDIAAQNVGLARQEKQIDATVIDAGKADRWQTRPTAAVAERMEMERDKIKDLRDRWTTERDAISVPKPPSVKSVERDLTQAEAKALRAARAREDEAKAQAQRAGLSARRLAQWYTNPEKAAMKSLIQWNAELDRLAAARRAREQAERALADRQAWLRSEPGRAAVQNIRQPGLDAAAAAKTERRTLDRKIARLDKRIKEADKAIETTRAAEILGKKTLRVPGDMADGQSSTNAKVHRYFKFNSFDAEQTLKHVPKVEVDKALAFVRGLTPNRPAPVIIQVQTVSPDIPTPTKSRGPDR